MLYTFKSKATADLLMLDPGGSELLRIIGKESSPKGIIEPADMPAAIEAIEAAILRTESKPIGAGTPGSVDKADAGKDKPAFVSLRQRAWPLVEMLKRAHAAGEVITWGV